MSSLGYVVGDLLLSLPPAPCTPPRPHGALLQAFRNHLPSWGQILYRSYENTSTPEPKLRWARSREARISRQASILLPLLSPLPPPLGRWLESSPQKAGNRTFGGASPGDPFLPITSPVRMAEWTISTVSPSSPAARTSRSGKAWQSRRGRGLRGTASWLMLLPRLPWWDLVKFHRVRTLPAPAEVNPRAGTERSLPLPSAPSPLGRLRDCDIHRHKWP